MMSCFFLLGSLITDCNLAEDDPTMIFSDTTLVGTEADFMLIYSSPMIYDMNHWILKDGKLLKWSDSLGWISNKCRNKRIKSSNGNRGGGGSRTH